LPGINGGGPAPEGEVKLKEAAIGEGVEGVEGTAEVRGVCDGEDIVTVEKVNSGLVDDDVDEREVGGVWL
jgi:hypothetical protein